MTNHLGAVTMVTLGATETSVGGEPWELLELPRAARTPELTAVFRT